MEIKELKTEKVSVDVGTESTSSMSKEPEKQTWSFWKNGIPSHIFPLVITAYALIERVLGGIGYKRFFELSTAGNNWVPDLLLISLGGTLGYRSFKLYHNRLERKDEQQSSSTVEGS